MNTEELREKLLEFVRERQFAHDRFTEDQIADIIRQMLLSGDIIRNVRIDGAQNVIYLPYAESERLKSRIEQLEKALDEAGGKDPLYDTPETDLT